MHQFTATLRNAEQKVQRLQGRDHRVFQMTLVQEQVLENNLGRTFLPAEEIEASVSAWNGMPVVLDHPTRGGQPISARDPEILNSVGVGTVYHAAARDGALMGQAWIPVDLIESDERLQKIVDRVDNEGAAEISTGFDASVVNRPGVHNGRTYDLTMGNLKPDHLALLTTQKGACSVADGCGITNSEGDEAMTWLDSLMGRLRGTVEKAANELHSDMERMAYAAIVAGYGDSVMLEDMDESEGMVVFTVYGDRGEATTLMADYTLNDGAMELGEASPARRRTTFERMENAGKVAPADPPDSSATDRSVNMDRKDMIAALVAANCGVSEEGLKALSDCDVKALHQSFTARNAEGAEEEPAGGPADASAGTEGQPTLADVMAELKALKAQQAPLLEERAENRQRVIEAIVNSRATSFTEDALKAMDDAGLAEIARLTNTSHLLRGGPRVHQSQEEEPAFMPPADWLADADAKEA